MMSLKVAGWSPSYICNENICHCLPALISAEMICEMYTKNDVSAIAGVKLVFAVRKTRQTGVLQYCGQRSAFTWLLSVSARAWCDATYLGAAVVWSFILRLPVWICAWCLMPRVPTRYLSGNQQSQPLTDVILHEAANNCVSIVVFPYICLVIMH